jgi:hypothetical protein
MDGLVDEDLAQREVVDRPFGLAQIFGIHILHTSVLREEANGPLERLDKICRLDGVPLILDRAHRLGIDDPKVQHISLQPGPNILRTSEQQSQLAKLLRLDVVSTVEQPIPD